MRFKGTDGDDDRNGTAEADFLQGLGGADRLFGAAGRDVLLGGEGDDILSGNTPIDDFLAQSGGADREVDRIDGGAGDDIVAGGWNDRLTGGEGADTLELDTRGYKGDVTLDFSALASGGSVRLGGGSIAGFERIGALLLGRGDDQVILGELIPAPLLGRSVEAGAGNDVIDARGLLVNPATVRNPNGVIVGGAYEIDGGAGNDVIYGSTFSDQLAGSDGDDRIVLGGGRDIAEGGAGADVFAIDIPTTYNGLDFVATIDGGAGDDQVELNSARSAWSAHIGASGQYYLSRTYRADPNREDIVRITGVESVKFTDQVVAFRDLAPGLVVGTERSDRIGPDSPGFAGSSVTGRADTIAGLGGDDVLDGGKGADIFYGGDGADTVYFDDVGDRIMDGEAEDKVVASVTFDGAIGYSRVGTVVLTGADAIDATAYYAIAITGNAGDNRLRGEIDRTLLEGGAGNDTLTGGIASYEHAAAGVTVDLAKVGVQQDTGGAGLDTIGDYVGGVLGSAFDDVLRASDNGGDRLDGGPGDDRLIGGRGHDYVVYAGATAGVTVDLSITTAQDTGGAGVDTLRSIEFLEGSRFGDVLTGSRGDNAIAGGDGDDRIDGGGGRGDELTGGVGADTFTFHTGGGAVLRDFFAPDGDRIDVSAIDADASTPGDQAFRIVSAFTGAAGELVIAQSASGGDVRLDFDGDRHADLTVSFSYAGPESLVDLIVL